MQKTYELHTYDVNGNTIVLNQHFIIYEPQPLFSLSILMARKINNVYPNVGVICYEYDFEKSDYSIKFDIPPFDINYLKNIFNYDR